MNPLADTAELPAYSDFMKLVAKHFGPGAPRTRVTFGALSHPGKVRTNNEDHYGVVRRHRSRDVLFTNLPDGYLPPTCHESYVLAVADGMGGAAFGELASMLALRTGWDLTSKAFHWPFLVNDREAEVVMEQLTLYGKLMHQALLECAKADPDLAGMGSTLTGILLVGTDAFIAHIGDSRAYLLRGGALRQLTHDHTQAQELVDAGVIASAAEAPRFMRHVLLNCLGGHGGDNIRVDTQHLPLLDGDRLLVCSDGLSDMVTDSHIAGLLSDYPAPADACQALLDAALDHGGKDNVTVVVACIEVA